jgi:hypothetical protein
VSPRQAALLDPDLEAGLKRLKLAAVRRMAAEVLQTAKVQRWPPDELLRTRWRPRSRPETPPTRPPVGGPQVSR